MAINTNDLDFWINRKSSTLKTLLDQIDLQLALERALEKKWMWAH